MVPLEAVHHQAPQTVIVLDPPGLHWRRWGSGPSPDGGGANGATFRVRRVRPAAPVVGTLPDPRRSDWLSLRAPKGVYSHSLVSIAWQWWQMRVSEATEPAQYGHRRWCTASTAKPGTKNSTQARGPNTIPATIPKVRERPGRCAAA